MIDTPLGDVAVALGRIPSGLFVVAATNPDGNETAFLASWVQQAGFEPPAVSVAVGKDRPAVALMEAPGSMFTVSVIADDEKSQVGPFARGIEPGVRVLDRLPIERTNSGQAAVAGCLAWLECRTLEAGNSGDHRIVIAEVVEALGQREDAPAVHVRRNGLGY
jgi:flavin reductase (DIM6/NTAB) family NADH-FMN oxidoreductase RutF